VKLITEVRNSQKPYQLHLFFLFLLLICSNNSFFRVEEEQNDMIKKKKQEIIITFISFMEVVLAAMRSTLQVDNREVIWKRLKTNKHITKSIQGSITTTIIPWTPLIILVEKVTGISQVHGGLDHWGRIIQSLLVKTFLLIRYVLILVSLKTLSLSK